MTYNRKKRGLRLGPDKMVRNCREHRGYFLNEARVFLKNNGLADSRANSGKTMIQIVRTRMRLVLALTLLSVGSASPLPATAQDFYAGKQITLIVGAGVGGGYDHQARLVARHLGRHLPGNPPIIVQNMPAAGSMAATNYMFSTAPRDGTAIALIQRGMLLAKLTYAGSARL